VLRKCPSSIAQPENFINSCPLAQNMVGSGYLNRGERRERREESRG
jgi:hypothetical protein